MTAEDRPPANEMRAVVDLHPLPGNPRHGDIGAISQSLERFGQQKPIVVNSDGIILAGNHTYQAAVALGWKTIWAVTADLDGRDQTGFALADNRLSDLATYDNEALLAMLRTTDLTGTGYDLDNLDELIIDVETPFSFQPLPDDQASRLDQYDRPCHTADCQHVCSE